MCPHLQPSTLLFPKLSQLGEKTKVREVNVRERTHIIFIIVSLNRNTRFHRYDYLCGSDLGCKTVKRCQQFGRGTTIWRAGKKIILPQYCGQPVERYTDVAIKRTRKWQRALGPFLVNDIYQTPRSVGLGEAGVLEFPQLAYEHHLVCMKSTNQRHGCLRVGNESALLRPGTASLAASTSVCTAIL